MGSRYDRIITILTETFAPTFLELGDESQFHRGHHGHTGRDETHFSVTISSELFNGKSIIASHRLVNAALKGEFDSGLHALTISISPSTTT
jgi:BolA family transcriptional regulator, general stress-responsive regulator